ncbi:MAG: 4-(cytidine 5'-diphospho)-2-C-methyl-D-erythritol kinase [Planctomycetes bacterium RBG_13_50_24]|nr:MAG: 4-(cytidine 5'-diphospho)-2-C-methyl-D-erythritol kinase [Planctomycetes bacterium RBG_13_50_24]
MDSREQITTVGNGLLVLAPAKINLSLLIAGKRPDGFHEIETIMAKIDWYDEILIQPGRQAGIELTCRGPNWAPAGEDNLVYKAAKSLLESCGLTPDVRITLTKNIPAGTGLGSASSDAAATLIGINHYFKLGLDQNSLFESAAKLGSDVAFFLGGPLAFCTGKGEKVKKLDEIFNFTALLILPDVSVSTKKVYANYQHNHHLYKKLNIRINNYILKNRIDLVVKMCTNMLAESCFNLEKSLAELKETIESLGMGPYCLSGSGSAMFCIIESGDEEKAREGMSELAEKTGCKSIIVRNNRW